MKVLQLNNIDGYHLGLYLCPDDVTSKQAEKMFNTLEDEYVNEDDIHNLIDEKLSADLGVERVRSEDIFANTL